MIQLRLFDEEDLETYRPYTFTNGKLNWDYPYKTRDGLDRPKCINIGCRKPVALSRGTLDSPTNRTFRSVCGTCHKAGYKGNSLPEGILSVKRNFCENIDGRLGFKCSTTIINSGQLELDHINGDHNHNTMTNIQTICKVCHAIKSHLSGDHKDQVHRKSKISSQDQNSKQSKTDPSEQISIPCTKDDDQSEILNLQETQPTSLS